jgi:hypothetical protein
LNDSYLFNNYIGKDCMIDHCDFNLFSYLSDNILYNNAAIENSLLDGSNIQWNTLNQYGMYNNTLINSDISYNISNSSYITENYLHTSTIQNNTLDNISYITGNTLNSSCTISGNVLNYSSEIAQNSLTVESGIDANINTPVASTPMLIKKNTLQNTSYIRLNTIPYGFIQYNFLASSCFIQNNTLENAAQINYNHIYDDSYITNVIMNQGYIGDNTIHLYTYFGNGTLTNCTIRYCNFNRTDFDFTASGTLTNKTISKLIVKNVTVNADLSSATVIYSNSYNKEIFSNASNQARLSYFNSSDVLTVVAVTA